MRLQVLGEDSNHPTVIWKGYMPRELAKVYRCVSWNDGYEVDHSKIVVHDPTSNQCRFVCNYMLQRNSAFARLNQVASI